jgi:phenylpyruvate tautomerase PptA (4-oxalocrotonate tautomerase family)
MPILEIEMVGRPRNALWLSRELATAAAAILSPDRPQATWVRLRWMESHQYGEGGRSALETPSPVFVRLLVASWPSEPERASLSARLADTIGDLCARSPSLVHILWEPPAAGRVAFGGQLLPSGALDSKTPE